MPSRNELIAERDRARDVAWAMAIEVASAAVKFDNARRLSEAREARALVWDRVDTLADHVRIWRVAADAVESDRPPRGSYRNARGIITPVVDELPEETISRMRDRDWMIGERRYP